MPTSPSRGLLNSKTAPFFVVLKEPLEVNEKLFQKLMVVL
jgi:hypothetical protein